MRNRPGEYADWASTINANLVDLVEALREFRRTLESLDVRMAALERRLEALEAKLR
jgi:uncharacterized protein YukE